MARLAGTTEDWERANRDNGNRIADGQAEESSEVGAVPFVTLDRVELCDASSLRSVPVVMLDDLAG